MEERELCWKIKGLFLAPLWERANQGWRGRRRGASSRRLLGGFEPILVECIRRQRVVGAKSKESGEVVHSGGKAIRAAREYG